jgi:GNAT superfamily N-acetyltransferase
MIDPLVRRAVPGDGAQLRELEIEARAALVDQRGGARWLLEHPLIGDGWEGHIDAVDADGFDVVVAHIGDVLVGYLVSELVDDLAGATLVRIDQVWVTPEARELGFGDEMLAVTLAHARAAGAVAVEGQALPGDRHTKNLYERAGIVARLITTYRALD